MEKISINVTDIFVSIDFEGAKDSCSFQCTVQSLVQAANIDFGILETNGQVQFALSAKSLKKQLLKSPQQSARADMRLKRMYEVLQNKPHYFSNQQKGLDDLQKKLCCEALVRKVMHEVPDL